MRTTLQEQLDRLDEAREADADPPWASTSTCGLPTAPSRSPSRFP